MTLTDCLQLFKQEDSFNLIKTISFHVIEVDIICLIIKTSSSPSNQEGNLFNINTRFLFVSKVTTWQQWKYIIYIYSFEYTPIQFTLLLLIIQVNSIVWALATHVCLPISILNIISMFFHNKNQERKTSIQLCAYHGWFLLGV